MSLLAPALGSLCLSLGRLASCISGFTGKYVQMSGDIGLNGYI